MNNLGEEMGFFNFFLYFEVSEGAKAMNMLQICVNNPHLLGCSTIYLGEGMGGVIFFLFSFCVLRCRGVE